MVFDAILTGQKFQCLYGNLMANNIFQKPIVIRNVKILGRRLYSPSQNDVAWLEDVQ